MAIIDHAMLCRILEGALLAAGEPLSLERMQGLFVEDDEQPPTRSELQAALASISKAFAGRGFTLVEVASGWRVQVIPEVAPWVNRLWEERPQRYSRALLETLALIAWRQPITRGDIEDIRGVAVSSNIIRTLMEREWVRVVGHRDVPGRPALYATTKAFLDYFNMTSLDQLPSLGEVESLEAITTRLALNEVIQPDTSPEETAVSNIDQKPKDYSIQ